MRKGIDDDHLTYLEAGPHRRGRGRRPPSPCTPARPPSSTPAQADWSAIAALKEAVTSIPVLGNGDIWSADDAVRMVDETGCDGVVVGRGCLGRPWLFGDLARGLRRPSAAPARRRPSAAVADAFRRHAELLVDFFDDEDRGCRDIRKHVAWYLKGYPVGGDTARGARDRVEPRRDRRPPRARSTATPPYPGAAAEGQRGRAGTPKRPALPDGWLDSQRARAEASRALADAELDHSGG